MCLRSRIEVSQRAARLDIASTLFRIDTDVFHKREIDHKAAVSDCIPSNIVSAAPDRERQVVLANEVQRPGHVVSRTAAGNQRRTAVDHAVPDLAHFVVLGIFGKNERARKGRLECIRRGVG